MSDCNALCDSVFFLPNKMPNQNIDIHIRLDVSSPPQETGPMDYVTLVSLCLVTVLEISACIYIYVRSRTYAPLRSNLNPLLYAMVACGLINSWGSFVAAKQLDSFEPVRTASCVLWHFWIEYFVGMNGVFVTLMLRALLRAYSFHDRIKLLSIQSKKILRNWLVLIVVAPLFVVCTYATVSGSSYYDPDYKTCATVIYVKGFLMLWVFIAGLGIFVSGAILENGISGTKLSERSPIRRCLAVAAFVGISCAIINTSGLMRYSIGRSLFTLLLLSVHAFLFASLIGYKTYKALANDQAYAFDFVNSKAVHDICFKSLGEIRHTAYIFKDFLAYCNNARPMKRKGVDAEATIAPQPFVQCYEQIQRWKDQIRASSNPINNLLADKTEAIINTYVRERADPRVCYDESIYGDILVNKGTFPSDLFDRLENHVLQELFDTWGGGYITQWNSRSIYNGYTFESPASPEAFDYESPGRRGPTSPSSDPSASLDDGTNADLANKDLSWLMDRIENIERARARVKNGDVSAAEEQRQFIEMNEKRKAEDERRQKMTEEEEREHVQHINLSLLDDLG